MIPLFTLQVTLCVLVVDQVLKAITGSRIGQVFPANPGSIALFPAVNESNALGVTERLFLTLALLAGIVLISKYLSFQRDFRLRLGAGLLAGGALGNGLSWIFQGYVIDYLAISCRDTEVIVNLADLAYVCGTLLVAFGTAREVRLLLKKTLVKE